MRVRRAYSIGAGLAAAAVLAVMMSPVNSNPPIHSSHTLEANVAVPSDVGAVLHRACYDCHSDQTYWPWYSSVPPISWVVHRDVIKGRSVLNFSEWSDGAGDTPQKAASSLIAACAELRAGSMPKRGYRLLHEDAKVESGDMRRLCEWTQQQAKALEREGRIATR